MLARTDPTALHEPRLGARVGDPQRMVLGRGWRSIERPGGPNRLWLTEPRSGAARLLSAAHFQGEQDLPRESGGPEFVLDVRRLPDADLLFLGEGGQRKGTLRNEAFLLKTAHGDLAFPAAVVAGIDLGDGRDALVSLVTVNRSRFTGFLGDAAFNFEDSGAEGPGTVRPEAVVKVVRRRRPDEATNQATAALVVLRNGDFCFATPRAGRFRIETTGRVLDWAGGEILGATFAPAEPGRVDLRMASQEAARATAIDEDFTFTLPWGADLRVHQRRLHQIRRDAVLPDDLARRIGVAGRAALPAPKGSPPDGVVPLEGMVWIGAGEFIMGSPDEEKDRDLDEGPQTRVVVPEGFWIGQREVTQGEYEILMGNNPSQYLGRPRNPVEKVSWQDAADYCRKLTDREHAAGRLPEAYAYRLPTEAEWEYACRAGTTTRFSFGDDPTYSRVRDHAWFNGNSDSATQPTGAKQPNPWGLHDMHGNVLEWCLDAWRGALPGGTVTNLARLPEGTLRTARGGSWLYEARCCRSANRDSYGLLNRCSDVGFRIVLARAP